MPRVYFHSLSGTAELRGSERSWLGSLVTDTALALLDPAHRYEQLLQLAHPEHYMARPDRTQPGWVAGWASMYATAFRVSWGGRVPLIQVGGQPVEPFTLALNTTHVVGGDALKLAARIHGQCELHAWVDGPNRAWLADIMQAGVDSGIYRRGFWVEDIGSGRMWSDQGWDSVIELLRARDDEPVVTSFSVCDEFPNSAMGDWMPAWPDGVPQTHEGWESLTDEQKQERYDRQDAWHELDAAEQWRISMAGLRARRGQLELRPDDWNNYHFGQGLTALDLIAPDADDRLAKALGAQESS